jgi:hypothetical protein
MGEPRHAQASGVGISMKPHGTCLTNEGGSHTHSGLWAQTARAGPALRLSIPIRALGLACEADPLLIAICVAQICSLCTALWITRRSGSAWANLAIQTPRNSTFLGGQEIIFITVKPSVWGIFLGPRDPDLILGGLNRAQAWTRGTSTTTRRPAA